MDPSRRGSAGYWVREAAEFVLVIALLALIDALVDLPRWLIVGVPLAKAFASAAFYLFFLRKVLRRPIRAGAESLIGRRALAATLLRPAGRVRIDGETWTARSASGRIVDLDTPLTVVGAEDGVLLVRPCKPSGPHT